MEKKSPKIGVFVCECGGNIGEVVDVKAVVDAVKTLGRCCRSQISQVFMLKTGSGNDS